MHVALRRLVFLAVAPVLAACGGDGGTAPTPPSEAAVPSAVLARVEALRPRGGTSEIDVAAALAQAVAGLVRSVERSGVRPTPIAGFGPGGAGLVLESELRSAGGTFNGVVVPPSTSTLRYAVLWNAAEEIVLAAPFDELRNGGMVVRLTPNGGVQFGGIGTTVSLARVRVTGPCAGFVATALSPSCDLGSYGLSLRADSLVAFDAQGGRAPAGTPGIRIEGATVSGVRRVLDGTRLTP